MRKLAASAAGFSAAVFLSHFVFAHEKLHIAGTVVLLVSLGALLLRGNKRIRIFIVLVSLAAGFLWCFTYNAVFVNPYRALHEREDVFQAVVSDYPAARNPRGYRVDAQIRLPGKPAAGIRLYYYSWQELKPGDIIEFKAKLRRSDISSEGEYYDTLTSRGIFLSASVSGDINTIGSSGFARYLPRKIAGSIAGKINEIYPEDAAVFLKALLTGMRDELNKDTALQASLSASGIIHIVAISGMHVSFLVSFLAMIIKNKRLFAVYVIPVLIFFMAMTGFSPAVTRAGTMQIFLICAPLFRRESDDITSLSAAMLVLLAVNPYACASVGLQLSFAATLGIILFTSRMSNAASDFIRGKKFGRKKIPKAVFRYIFSGFAATIGALVFTLPLSAVHFGYVSLIAPLTNLLTMGVVSVVFPLGMVSGMLGFIHPIIGSIAAVPAALMVKYITAVASLFASVPFSVVYSSNMHIMLWLAYVYVMFITLPLLKARFRQYLYPVCISVIMLFAVILVSLLMPAVPGESITVVDVGQGLSVVASFSDGYTMVIDCGSISTNRAGEITHEFLLGSGCTSVDLLALTHFHEDHINGVELLLSRINVSALAIPDPEGSYAAEDIIELARRRGTDIIYVTETLYLTIGDSSVYIYPPLGSGDENERGLSFLIMGGVTALITGDMNSTVERTLLRFADLPKLDLLVAGHHGSRESTSEELLNALMPDIAIIPVGRNSFGHPHPETLERLERAGVTVYRTDEMGHVTVTTATS